MSSEPESDVVITAKPIRYICMYSGGLVSYAAAQRTIERHGSDGVVLLFADTRIEDEDLYRFIDESAESLGVPLIKIADGRNPWEVFRDERFVGNSRVDPCSKILKRKLMNRWCAEHCDPAATVLVFGLDWQERHRIEDKTVKGEVVAGHARRMADMGWKAIYPMNERPYLVQDDIISHLKSVNIRPPRLYEIGFPHNNCGGFCVKMGLAQARHLLYTMPDRYRWHEEQEAATMAAIGPTARPFLRIRRKGKSRGITMAEFRRYCEKHPLFSSDYGWGCSGGCAIDD